MTTWWPKLPDYFLMTTKINAHWVWVRHLSENYPRTLNRASYRWMYILNTDSNRACTMCTPPIKSTLVMFREIILLLGAESVVWDAKPMSYEILTSYIECGYSRKQILRKLCDAHWLQRTYSTLNRGQITNPFRWLTKIRGLIFLVLLVWLNKFPNSLNW